MENENQTQKENENVQSDSAYNSSRENNDKETEQKKELAVKNRKKRSPGKVLKMIVLSVVFFAVWFAIVQYIAADKYDAVVKVIEANGKIGVNPMTERLDYGDLPKGNASTRFVTIENNGKMDIYVAIVKYGEIAELIKINKNNFVLAPGEKEKLELPLEMPISANKEEYKGKVVVFKFPKVF